ncbi:hypothetical protein [Mesorhizobium loti]|uniref:Nucleoside phosphorylase domain-containing protein n=1 Tax=Mesorhizobium loti R88b TaxID=935548 RepID=A0A6M7WRJ2_RHILI|nr:hypothetical protein [Mesorhizobium loti]QKD03473.1 hypothetical protein EB235_19820 [Mesorhizobium loti R88b]
MKLVDKAEILKDAETRGLRRALFVTALDMEMSAVRAHLTHLGSCQARDGNIVEIGQFSAPGDEWLVVVTESGAGTHAAQTAVTYASVDFGPFEVMLFVGVAASRKPEAPIGAVVVSNHVYFPYSGKYQGGEFSSRPHTFPVDPRLVGLAKKLRRDSEWQMRIRDLLRQKLPDTSVYPQPFPPGCFVAPIISVEAVSADAESELEKQISKHYGDSLALEMEGYGALYAGSLERTPSIVVRGISDMRKEKTPELDAIYQPVAAAHAAAFGFELLAAWSQSSPALRPAPAISATPESGGAEENITSASAGVESARTTLVLNFAGNATDFPKEKIDQIIDGLRSITGDPELSLVRTEVGSFHIFVSARVADIARLSAQETFRLLQEKFQSRLLGVSTESELLSTPTLGVSMLEASRPLLDWPKTLPDGTAIHRPELDHLLSLVQDSESSTTALLGLPGAGKSALLAAFGQRLHDQNIPFLAIKADLLDLDISNEEGISRSIGLDHVPSKLLLELSRTRPTVLIIDQLDALAGYVDLRTGRLNVLLNLVRKLSGSRNIHIVLSARTFEYDHDVRLRTIHAESLNLELPPWSTVLSVLEKHGIQAAGWPANAQEVMRSPQALATYLKLGERAGSEPFAKYQTMLNHLWEEHILKRPDGAKLSKLAGNIAEQMAELETMWLNSARFEENTSELDTLIALGILTRYGAAGRIGFSHQTVFEHALARAFSQQTGRLSRYILEREASLFVRPKLWAALTYLRDVEPPTYLTELRAIWSTQNLRIHLQHLLIEFLGQQSEPIDPEVLLMGDALNSAHRQIALQAIVGSDGWFGRLQHAIAAAMTIPGEDNIAAAILSRAFSSAPETVTSLLRSHWLPDKRFDRLTLFVIQSCPHWTEGVLEIASSVAARSATSPYEFDHIVGTLGASQPDMALRFVRSQLDAQLKAAIEEGQRRMALVPPEGDDDRIVWRISNSPTEPITKVIENSNGWDSLEALAREHPKDFLRILWPWFRHATDVLRDLENDTDGPGFALSYQVDFRFDGESPLDLPEHPIQGALRTAAEELAKEDEAEFLGWIDRNQYDDSTPAQRLFAYALASQPEKYADQSLQFFLQDTNRFHLGNLQDTHSTTTKLIRAASPYWSDSQVRIFEKTVFDYSPKPRSGLDASSKRYFGQRIRRLKTDLLEALPRERTSEEVKRFITEQRRQFPAQKDGVRSYGPQWIGSAIAAENLAKASDDDIINAFTELPDASGWDHPKHWMKGGNVQLSREFAEFAKSKPDRASAIIKKMTPDIGTRAAGYALDAMAEAASAELILELINHLDQRGFSGEEYRGSAARAVERLVRRDLNIDEKTIALLESWLAEKPAVPEREDSDDEDDEEIFTAATNDAKKEERQESILWGMGGLRILPHGNYPIIEVLFQIFLRNKDYLRVISMLNGQLSAENDSRIWEALLRFLPYIPSTHISELTDFLDRLFGQYPELARTHEGLRLLAQLHWKADAFVGSLLSRWDYSASASNEQGYGELVALISLVQPSLDWPKKLLNEILSKPELSNARIGAAYAAVNVWSEEEWQVACSTLLQRIIPIADKLAWVAIFDLFRLVDEITPEPHWIQLLRTIEEHLANAKGVNSSFVVERLQTLLPHSGQLVGRFARGLIANWRTELADMSTGTATVAPEFVDIAITLHRLGPDTRELGTELFEDLLQANAYTARETLDQIDNRFRSIPTSRRPRLPRRSRNARSRRQPKSVGGE